MKWLSLLKATPTTRNSLTKTLLVSKCLLTYIFLWKSITSFQLAFSAFSKFLDILEVGNHMSNWIWYLYDFLSFLTNIFCNGSLDLILDMLTEPRDSRYLEKNLLRLFTQARHSRSNHIILSLRNIKLWFLELWINTHKKEMKFYF